MSNLSAFLKPAYNERQVKIILGDRFLNDNGEPEPVIMKSLTQEKIQEIARRSTHDRKINGRIVQDIDAVENMNRCLIESIVFPDLRSTELCRANGVEDPVSLPSKLFLVEEYTILTQTFAKLNGIKLKEDGEFEIPGEITKN